MTQDNNANKPTDNAGQVTAEQYLKGREISPSKPWFDPHNEYYNLKASVLDDFATLVAEERCREKEAEIAKLKDELLEARGLKNRDKYQDGLCRAYQKGKN
jgi:hypothetical protein